MPRFMESEGLFRGLILPILMLMLMNHFDYIQDIKWLIYEFKGPLSAHFLPKNIFKDFFEQNFINYTDSSELVDFDCFPANWALHIEGHVPFFNVQTVVDTCDVRNSLNKLLGMANDFLVEDLSRDLERNEWWSLTSFVNRLVQSEQPEYSKLRYLYQIGLDEEHTIIELNNLNEAVKIIEIPVEGSNQDIRAYWTIPKGCVENYKNAPTVLYLDGLDGDLWRTFKTISMFRNDLRVNSIALIPRGLGKNSPHMIVTKKSIITDVHVSLW